MAANNVRFFAYGRLQDNTAVGFLALTKNLEMNYKNEATNLMSKLKLLNLAPNERQKCNTQNGAWFCRSDSNGIIYMALCETSYPERHAYALIDEAQEELEKLPNYYDESEANISKFSKRCLPSLLKKYDDLASIDRVHAAQHKADEVKNVMTDNIRGMMNNMQNLETLEHKSSSMQSQAQMFSNDATQLKKIMYRRALKMKIMIALLIIAVILFITIPLATKGKNSDTKQ